MSITFTFDLQHASSVEYNYIQSFFERLGWQRRGGSTYRYPGLDIEQDETIEDWFNHVIPALMLFRAYVVDSGRNLTRATLDVQSSVELDYLTGTGVPPLPSEEIDFYEPNNAQFAESRLTDWLDDVEFPYDVGD